jgi:hypothetical protein
MPPSLPARQRRKRAAVKDFGTIHAVPPSGCVVAHDRPKRSHRAGRGTAAAEYWPSAHGLWPRVPTVRSSTSAADANQEAERETFRPFVSSPQGDHPAGVWPPRCQGSDGGPKSAACTTIKRSFGLYTKLIRAVCLAVRAQSRNIVAAERLPTARPNARRPVKASRQKGCGWHRQTCPLQGVPKTAGAMTSNA